MKIIFFSIFFAGISINAQFAYPEAKTPNPIQELDTKEEFENRIIGNHIISELQTINKSESKTDVWVKKFDRSGKILFSSWNTELPAGQKDLIPPGPVDFPQARKDQYTTTLSEGRITSFEYSSQDHRPKKGQVSYDAENNISKIQEQDETYDYVYEKGRLTKGTKLFGNSKAVGTYQYDSAGKIVSLTSELIFPNGSSRSGSETFEYDKAGNIILDRYKTWDGIVEKQYTYQNNLLTKFVSIYGKNIRESRTYSYDGTGKLKEMTKTEYDFGSDVVKNKTISQYTYKNGLISVITRLQGYDDRKATYTDVFSYDNQNRIINIKTQSQNTVFNNMNVAYGKNTITLTKDNSQSVYTLYE
ncbi:hypothetical protein ACM46_16045 [Chryseobacterium angstadtii]|uniref:Sugar-binding protein n=1 Tax=Chryseobacterium angstadtii TaxID=558151 RepID=A0A0J7I587_9FLAO|nr:hypothetical protein [Chryseobacterium angstadtii]KMQ61522.1 hypothetical protein ACM46_16045 [Chryseobacterium angstadtii]